MKLEVSYALAADELRLRCSLHNPTPHRIYVLHLSMNTGEPELWIRRESSRIVAVDLGLSTTPPSSVPVGMCVYWPSRSAGEPVEPGATLALERPLELPLVESLATAQPADSPDRETTEVDTLIVRCFYAAPPVGWEKPARSGLAGVWDGILGRDPRPPRAVQGYDLREIASETVQASVTLSRPVPLIGLRGAKKPNH
jgi:hypothetical protein